MAGGDRWTPEEEEEARRYAKYSAYAASVLNPRSEASWRTKRNKMGMAHEGSNVPDESPVVPLDIPEWDSVEPFSDYYERVKQITRSEIAQADKPQILEWTSPDPNWIGIFCTGDWHLGGLTEYDILEQDLMTLRDTPGMYGIATGDLINNFQRGGPKLQHAMAEDPVARTSRQTAAVKYVLHTYGPKELIAVCEGNHDRFGDTDYLHEVAKMMKAHHVGESGASIHIKLNDQEYVVYVQHAHKGGRNDGKNLMHDFPDFANPDVTILGHLHDPETQQKQYKGNSIVHQRVGTYKLTDAHATKRGYSPGYGPSLFLLHPEDHVVLPFNGPLWRWGVQFLGYLRREYKSQ